MQEDYRKNNKFFPKPGWFGENSGKTMAGGGNRSIPITIIVSG
jgi:hypothetical protein